MKRIVKLVLLLLFSFTTLAVSDAKSQAKVGDQFSTVLHQNFLQSFDLSAAGLASNGTVTPTNYTGTQAVELLPKGNYARHWVSLNLGLEDGVIQQMELRIARPYMDTEWVAARGFACDFLRASIPVDDEHLTDTLCNEIEYPQDKSVDYTEGMPQLPAVPSEAYQVFLGKQKLIDERLPHSELWMENYRDNGVDWLKITITAKQPERKSSLPVAATGRSR